MERFIGLDNVMSTFGINSAKVFDAYYKQVLSPLESQELNIEGFVWDEPQLNFTYEQLEAEQQVEVMATYTDLNSPALPTGKSAKLRKLTGTIPRQKFSIVRGENDYRKELIVLNNILSVAAFKNVNPAEEVKSYLAKYLFTTLADIPNAHKNSLNYQVGQMKSKGVLTLDDTNNPRGIKGVTFTANVPTENKVNKDWFTKDTAGALTEVPNSNPLDDIRDFVREVRMKAGGYQNVCVEISEKYFYRLTKHSAVLRALGYASSGIGLRYTKSNDENAVAVGRGLALEVQKEVFKQYIEADAVIFNKTQCGVEKLNTTTKEYERKLLSAFDEEVVLVRPTGIIGTIKCVQALRPDGSAIAANIFDGRGIIEYLYDARTRTQEWRSELTALAVPNRPRDMYYINGIKPATTV